MRQHGWIRNHYVALLALFVALGGTSYAVVKAPKNSVSSKSIKKAAVRSSDLQDDGVKGIDVDEESLDLSGLPGLAGPAGPRGARGDRGPMGPTFATAGHGPDEPVTPVTPDIPVVEADYTHTFVTPSSGRLLAFASMRVLGVDCSAGTGRAHLYLDGVGVPGSGAVVGTAANPSTYTPFAVTGVVPAGEHTLTVALDCSQGNAGNNTNAGDGDFGAVLVGG